MAKAPTPPSRGSGLLNQLANLLGGFPGLGGTPPGPNQQQQLAAQLKKAQAAAAQAATQQKRTSAGVERAQRRLAQARRQFAQQQQHGPPTPQAHQAVQQAQRGLARTQQHHAAAVIATQQTQQQVGGIQQQQTSLRNREFRGREMSGALGSLWGAASGPSESLGATYGGVARAGEHVGRAVGGPVGRGTEVVSKFARTLTEAVDRLQSWNRELMQSNFRFAEFSVTMSRVQVLQQIQEMQLSRERGERRAPTAATQSVESMRLQRNVGSIQDLFGSIQNVGSTWLTRGFNTVLEQAGIPQAADALTQWINQQAGTQPGQSPWLQEIQKMEEEHDRMMHTRPQRMR